MPPMHRAAGPGKKEIPLKDRKLPSLSHGKDHVHLHARSGRRCHAPPESHSKDGSSTAQFSGQEGCTEVSAGGGSGPVACMAALRPSPHNVPVLLVAQELMNHKLFTLFWDLDNARVPARSLGPLNEHLKVCTQPEHNSLATGQQASQPLSGQCREVWSPWGHM